MTDTNDRSADHFDANPAGIPDPDEFPHMSVATACRITNVSKRTGYAAAQRGEWPVIRVGRAVRVRTRPFLQQYGLLDETSTTTANAQAGAA